MNSPQLLSSFEHCDRKGFWDRDWDRAKIDFHELLMAGITEGVTTTRQDLGTAAGEAVIGIASEREILTKEHNVYDLCVHHASIADLVSTAIRKPSDAPWGFPEPQTLPNGVLWHSGAFLSPDGTKLRRIVLATNWSDDRHWSEEKVRGEIQRQLGDDFQRGPRRDFNSRMVGCSLLGRSVFRYLL